MATTTLLRIDWNTNPVSSLTLRGNSGTFPLRGVPLLLAVTSHPSADNLKINLIKCPMDGGPLRLDYSDVKAPGADVREAQSRMTDGRRNVISCLDNIGESRQEVDLTAGPVRK